jgi:D-sedoheptulose 7-phosphate isomerase
MTTFTETYLEETCRIVGAIDTTSVELLAEGLAQVRERSGRLFILGVGGSAGHSGHAVNDFRKICGIEAYAPTDNVSELTARTNDEGWDTTFSAWLAGSRLRAHDGVLVFSVGGGDRERGISANIVNALELARQTGCFIGGVVGRDGGYTARVGDVVVILPPLVEERITPHTEGLCAVVWHLLVSHPRLQSRPTKWESSVTETVWQPGKLSRGTHS